MFTLEKGVTLIIQLIVHCLWYIAHCTHTIYDNAMLFIVLKTLANDHECKPIHERVKNIIMLRGFSQEKIVCRCFLNISHWKDKFHDKRTKKKNSPSHRFDTRQGGYECRVI